MGFSGHTCHSMKFNRIPWTSMELYGTPWTLHGTQWNSIDTPWNSMELHGPSMELNGTPQTPWSSMDMPWKLHGVPCNPMELHGTLHGTPWNSMGLFHTGMMDIVKIRTCTILPSVSLKRCNKCLIYGEYSIQRAKNI